jgi:hypothetical protein
MIRENKTTKKEEKKREKKGESSNAAFIRLLRSFIFDSTYELVFHLLLTFLHIHQANDKFYFERK